MERSGSTKADYEFSSVVETEGDERVNYMHVMAQGCKLRDLQQLIEEHLTVTSTGDMSEEFARRINYSGNMQGVDYNIILECGTCPIADCSLGHNVEIRSPIKKEDRLSPIVEKEMKGYEIENTQHIKELDSDLEGE